MIIKFLNGMEFEYSNAYAIEKDYCNGEIRPSIEIHMPLAQTSYDEIASIVNDENIIGSFTLIGEVPAFPDGSFGELPINTYEGYVFGDKIIVENGIITFKKYKASIVELENEELKAVVDELLIAMEV